MQSAADKWKIGVTCPQDKCKKKLRSTPVMYFKPFKNRLNQASIMSYMNPSNPDLLKIGKAIILLCPKTKFQLCKIKIILFYCNDYQKCRYIF